MEHYLLIARSVTLAQRMERTLSRAGIRGGVLRTPMELSEGKGCTYAVQLEPSALRDGLNVLSGAGVRPVQIFYAGPNGYREVAV